MTSFWSGLPTSPGSLPGRRESERRREREERHQSFAERFDCLVTACAYVTGIIQRRIGLELRGVVAYLKTRAEVNRVERRWEEPKLFLVSALAIVTRCGRSWQIKCTFSQVRPDRAITLCRVVVETEQNAEKKQHLQMFRILSTLPMR